MTFQNRFYHGRDRGGNVLLSVEATGNKHVLWTVPQI